LASPALGVCGLRRKPVETTPFLPKSQEMAKMKNNHRIIKRSR
jgi:hypothetical protein